MTPKKLVDHLETSIGIDGPPRRIDEAIERALCEQFGLPPIQAAERAEALIDPVRRAIIKREMARQGEGIVAALTVLGGSHDTVAGSCFVLSSDSQEIAGAKRSRLHHVPLLEAMQAMSFSQFEQFGACVLKELGAQRVTVTPHAGDQGIDFFGRLNIGELQGSPVPFFKLAHDVELRFAGQAKHYPNRSIGPSVLREIVGAVILARSKTFSKDIDVFDGLDLRALSPVLPLVFTTGNVSSGAVRLAKDAGMIVRSGAQLAVFLADRGVGMRQNESDMQFDAQLFEEWLDTE